MSLMSGEMGRYQSFHPHPLNLGTVNILVFFSNSPFLREQYTARLLCKYFEDFVHPSNDSLQWAQLARMTNTQPTSSQDSFLVGGPNFLKGSFWYCWNQSTFYDSTGRESAPFPISTVHPAQLRDDPCRFSKILICAGWLVISAG